MSTLRQLFRPAVIYALALFLLLVLIPDRLRAVENRPTETGLVRDFSTPG